MCRYELVPPIFSPSSGRMGAGKSTLLKVMMGLVRAGSGAVVREKKSTDWVLCPKGFG